jgi:hypothetical protein
MPVEIAVQRACTMSNNVVTCDKQTRKTEVTRDTKRPGVEGARCDNRPSGHNGITDKQDNRVGHQDGRTRGPGRNANKAKKNV